MVKDVCLAYVYILKKQLKQLSGMCELVIHLQLVFSPNNHMEQVIEQGSVFGLKY